MENKIWSSESCGNFRKNASSGPWVAVILPVALLLSLINSAQGFLFLNEAKFYLILQVSIVSYFLWKQLFVPIKVHESILRNLLHLPCMTVPLAALMFHTLTVVDGIAALLIPSLCMSCQVRLTHWLHSNHGSSFSKGELLLVSQAGVLVLVLSLVSSYTVIASPVHLSGYKEMVCFVQVAVIVVALLVALLLKIHFLRTIPVLVSTFLFFGAVGIAASTYILGTFSVSWLLLTMFESKKRIFLIVWWAFGVLVSVAIVHATARLKKYPRTVNRKLYHILMLLVFLPGLICDPQFTYFASSSAIIFMLLLEVIRISDIPGVSHSVSDAFDFFLDEKDSGTLILSYSYLVVAFSVPLWLEYSDFSSSEYIIYSGVFSIGVGDTFASIGGSYFGKITWPETKKTIEGSLFGLVGQIGVASLLAFLGYLPYPGFLVLGMFGFLMIIEAFTDQVDNLVLPLIMYIFLKAVQGIHFLNVGF